jgi:hypothetical protein
MLKKFKQTRPMKNDGILCFLAVLVSVSFACTTTEQSKNNNAVPTSSANTNSATSQSSPAPSNSDSAPMNEDVILHLSVEEDSTLRPKIVGKTNLPDKTELLVTVSGKSTNFTGQEKTSVHAGRFQAGPFGSSSGLQPGQYTVDVVVAVPLVQPDSVRAVIGQNGENLKGSLVTKGRLGVSVEVEQAFKITSTGITSGKTDKKEVQAALIQAREILRALKNLEQQGRSMEALRNTDDLSKVRQCGDLMRERGKKAKELESNAGTLPNSYGFRLRVAASELSMCVTCANDAIRTCDIARSTLKDAEKVINETK